MAVSALRPRGPKIDVDDTESDSSDDRGRNRHNPSRGRIHRTVCPQSELAIVACHLQDAVTFQEVVMSNSHTRLIAVAFAGSLSLASCGGGASSSMTPIAQSALTDGGHNGNATPPDNAWARQMPSPPSMGFTVVATGLENPRGIEFGPDGQLYVAEGGLGGSQSTKGRCRQVPAPVGPYTGGSTGRISAIDVTTGARTTIVDNLPSSQTAAQSGGFVSGVADVAFLQGTLYALIAGAGCSHGLAGTFNSIDRISASGIATPIVNFEQISKESSRRPSRSGRFRT